MRTRAISAFRVAWSLSLSLVFLLPLAALAHRPGVALSLKAGLIVLLCLSALRPAEALTVLVAVLPLTLAIEILGSGLSSADLTECLALTFVAGGALRLARLAQRAGRLAGPALVFGAAVLASVVVELRTLQAIAPGRGVASEVWQYLTQDYWGDPRPFAMVHQAVRWLSVLALAVLAERTLRQQPMRAAAVVRVWLVAGAAAGVYGVLRLIEVLANSPVSIFKTLRWVVQNYRISAFHPDPNAAGSYFVVILVAAVIVAVRRRPPWVWAGVLPLVALAFALAQSRAAIGACIIVLAAYWLVHLPRRRRVLLAVTSCVLCAVVLTASLAATRRSHGSVGEALELRREMTIVGVRMVERYPVFGVGVSDYVRASRRFMTDDMVALDAFAPIGENAHNNFLQILAELGAPAFAAFLWLVWPTAVSAWSRAAARDACDRDAIAAGLLAFLISALFGHPLLITEVAVAFFLALGIAASGTSAPADARGWRAQLTGAGVVFFLVSVLWRMR